VDGAIACAFVDLLRGCKAFSQEEADQYIQMGSLNALFVLGGVVMRIVVLCVLHLLSLFVIIFSLAANIHNSLSN